ncbi:hypothetical protein M885DRAFT_509763 [Pelagophyceae sp. CCMP2097]|nr:hypothetical protein M885DRAFT_509763 [Pelagophyceae sp. CCMP2097]
MRLLVAVASLLARRSGAFTPAPSRSAAHGAARHGATRHGAARHGAVAGFGAAARRRPLDTTRRRPLALRSSPTPNDGGPGGDGPGIDADDDGVDASFRSALQKAKLVRAARIENAGAQRWRPPGSSGFRRREIKNGKDVPDSPYIRDVDRPPWFLAAATDPRSFSVVGGFVALSFVAYIGIFLSGGINDGASRFDADAGLNDDAEYYNIVVPQSTLLEGNDGYYPTV